MEKISQSIYKDWQAYQAGNACGLQFKSKYIDGTWKPEQSEAQAAGWWFEDMLVRGSSTKEPKRIKSGEPNALYRALMDHLITGQLMLNNVNINFSNRTIEHRHVTGTPDIVCADRIIDVKTSGHLNNKYDAYGWGALDNPESRYYADQVRDKRIQALTYLYLADGLAPIQEKVRVVEFWVFANNSDDVRVFRFTFTDEEVAAFAAELAAVLEDINAEELIGFTARPSWSRCKACQLRGACAYERQLPDVVEVLS